MTEMRPETGMENIARSIREGVFPKQLNPIMVPVFSKESSCLTSSAKPLCAMSFPYWTRANGF